MPPDGPVLVERMCRAAAHRGPDGSGVKQQGSVVLGHRRLSIIDMAGGTQPMVSEDGGLLLTFNGEIYNYREIRAELRSFWRFRTVCDTEVLLAAWARWGEGCVPRLRGMFAFGIWDGAEDRLTLVRDRFGIKPLYYVERPDGVVFASESGQLRAANMRLDPDQAACARFLDYGVVEASGPGTFFQGVSQLPPGTMLRVDQHGLRRSEYYRPAPEVDPSDLTSVLQEAVRLHLRSDVPVGSCLSGGLDSSTLVGLTRQVECGAAQPTVITAGSENPALDERRWATLAAKSLGLPQHFTVPSCDGLLNDLEHLVRSQGEPFSSTGVYAQYCVMRMAQRCGLKVMLDGQGADELFGGYLRHRVAWLRELIDQRSYWSTMDALAHAKVGQRARVSLAASSVNPFRPSYALLSRYRREGSESLCGPSVEQQADGRALAVSSSFTGERSHDVVQGTLPALLRYEDRNSMAFSVEARVPYVDDRVAGAALAIPGPSMFRDGWSKAPLRGVAAGLLPTEIAYRRDKLGFATAESAWFRGRLGIFAEEVFTDSTVASHGLLDMGAASRCLRGARAGGSTAKAWRALSLLLWLKWCVD